MMGCEFIEQDLLLVISLVVAFHEVNRISSGQIFLKKYEMKPLGNTSEQEAKDMKNKCLST